MFSATAVTIATAKSGCRARSPAAGASVYLTIDAEIQKIVYDVLKESVAALRAHGGRCIVMDPGSGRILAMVDEPSFDPNCPGRLPPRTAAERLHRRHVRAGIDL